MGAAAFVAAPFQVMIMAKNSDIFQLFTTFMKIGAFTFGGGYAMIPLIRRETVENKAWITDDDILEIVAVAESTPGPVAINAATFVGSRVAGFLGAAAATVGVVLPSFVIIYIISHILRQFQSLAVVGYAFNGIRAGVLALIINALWTMAHKCEKSTAAYVIMLSAFLAALLGVNVLLIIICSAAAGWALSAVGRGKE